MKIYTKTGDYDETSLLGGKRVKKSCLEMEAIGEVDELNSWLGILIEEIEDKFKKEARKLEEIQRCLFSIGVYLAGLQMSPDSAKKFDRNLTEIKRKLKGLEKWIDEMEKTLPKLKHFIAYEGTEEAVKAFYARAICRRAERAVLRLSEKHTVLPVIKEYMNRLSDVLFVLGRWFNK